MPRASGLHDGLLQGSASEVIDVGPRRDSLGGAKGGGGGRRQRTLGTFAGVYIPCINSIFGVVLFLRWGWAVGQIGVSGALSVLLLGTIISFITAAHVSALATNGQVETGGAYYLLSRALGPEFGGAVGFLFYIAQAFGVGLYTLGFTEALLPLLEESPVFSRILPCTYMDCTGEERFFYPNEELISSATLLLLLGLNLLGAHWFARVSSIIAAVVVTGVICGAGSIVAYSLSYDPAEDLLPPKNLTGFVGISWERLRINWGAELLCEQDDCRDSLDVFYVVGVILPAVTGLLNGASMSGDLKDPGRAIPIGTLWAVVTMVLVYSALIVLQGAAFERSALRSNYSIFQQITFFPWIVLTSTIFATLSPAFTTMAGMSRILEAQAQDGLYGRWLSPKLAKGYGSRGDPRLCFLLSWFLAQVVCLFGEVNLAATFVTIFFFTTYAALNIACAVLILSGAPNFRPEFKFYNLWISLIGALLCLSVAFFVSITIAFASLVLAFVAFGVLSITSLSGGGGGTDGKRFADVSQALVYQFSHRYLLTLDLRKAHAKFWRPQVLVLIDGADAEGSDLNSSVGGEGGAGLADVAPMIGLAHQLRSASSGLLLVAQVLRGSIVPPPPDELQPQPHIAQSAVAAAGAALVDLVEGALGENIAFSTVTVARCFAEGVSSLLLSAGLGPIRPNTIVLPFPADTDVGRLEDWAGTVRTAAALGRTVVATRGFTPGGYVPDSFDQQPPGGGADADGDSGSLRTSLADRFRLSVSAVMPAGAAGLLLPGGARLGGDHIPRIIEEIFPSEEGGPPLVDLRVDIARHGPRKGLTVDVWVLDGAALAAENFASTTTPSRTSPRRRFSASSVNSDADDDEFGTPAGGERAPDGREQRRFVDSQDFALRFENFRARTLVLLQLAFLLHLDPFWLRFTRLRVLVLVPPGSSPAARDWLLRRIREMMSEARIYADLVPVSLDELQPDGDGAGGAPSSGAESVNALVKSVSAPRAGLILLQAGEPAEGAPAAAAADASVEAGGPAASLALWSSLEALSRELPVPALLVFASDEQVTTDEL